MTRGPYVYPQISPRVSSAVRTVVKMISLLTKSLVTATTAILLVSTGLSQQAVSARSISYELNIPAENLDAALQALALASHHKLFYRAELVAGKESAALIGSYTTEEAVKRLLEGTKLSFEITPASVVLIKALDDKPATVVPNSSGGSVQIASPGPSDDASTKGGGKQSSQEFRLAQVGQGKATSDVPVDNSDEPKRKDELTEVVVTGTSIHNIEPITPTVTITGQQMIEQGYSRLDQVFDQLPQNFNGASQTANGYLGVGNAASTNQFLGSGVDLRGLGVGATLVLLNGRRLAMTADGTSVDITSIPVSAIDRVEILTDGASAIYGADAVAGVVNIITKRDYSGVETGVRSTGISKGKTADYGGNILGGYDWSSGNFLISFDGEKSNELWSSARSFEPSSSAPFDLLPEQIRRSLYASVRQELTSQLSIASDVLASTRSFTQNADAVSYGPASGSAQQIAASLEADYKFAQEWNLKLSGQFSREKDFTQHYAPMVRPSTFSSLQFYDYKTSSANVVVDGKLVELPGGALKVAFGGEAKRESLLYDNVSSNNGVYSSPPPDSSADRTSEAAFGELYIPIVGPQNAIPLVRNLNLDVAGRFDHYSDFGSTTNPKVSLQWVPIEGVTAHGSYSKSFRAPPLFDLGAGLAQYTYFYPVTNPASPTGTTPTLLLDGSNPNLLPERANTFSAGLTFKPVWVPGLKVDFSFFHIDYKDRIDRLYLDGYFTNVITAANQLGSLVNLNPTLSQVNALLNQPGRTIYNYTNGVCQVGTPGCTVDAASVGAIANIGYNNVGVAAVQGYDLDAKYDWDTGVGHFFVDGAGTLMTENSIQITPTTVTKSLLNDFGNPLRFRAKANFGWSVALWSAYGRVNFANAYHNSQDPNCPVLPGCSISSWTTVDSGLAFTTRKDNAGIGGGIRVALDVMNLFNRAPPYVNRLYTTIPLTYDPLNANPLLRTLSISIVKKW